MSVERYSVGNRVYRHGSYAPTMGTVNPSGYVERELRKRMLGTDGMSDTRSGLAAAALQRIQGGLVNRTVGPAYQPPQPTRQTQPYMPGGVSTVPGAGLGQSALAAKLAAVKAEHLAQVHEQQAAMKAKQAARPTVSKTGKVTPTSKPKPTALPWDMDAMTQKINAGNELQQLKNAILAQRQSAQRDYSQGVHALDAQQPEAERGLLNQFAGRGLAFGSGYGMGVGNLQNQFAGQRSGLQGQLTDLMNSYQNQETTGSAKYNQTLAAIQQALAQRLSKRAGTLGWGPVK